MEKMEKTIELDLEEAIAIIYALSKMMSLTRTYDELNFYFNLAKKIGNEFEYQTKTVEFFAEEIAK